MENRIPKKILIVDDEAYIRLLIEQTLEDLEDQEITIMTTDNGQDALRLIQEEEPQMVIMDVMMPIIDGFEVCRRIKQDLKLSHIYVVLLTAKGQAYDRQTGIEVGADTYITKPFNPDELLKLAETIFQR
jgi:two-component system, OmpR family, alkaline phosphatase synthesis response regulator PhoP